MPEYPLETLFPTELQARLDEKPLLVLPIGTIEWHSHHLPLGFDGIVAQSIGSGIAAASDAVLAPVTYWAAGGVPYPHTLKLTMDVIQPLLHMAFAQFAEMGFKVICAYTGHFGIEQTLALKQAALMAMQASSVTILPITAYDLVSELYKGDHAATGETAMMQAIHPELVRLNAVSADEDLDGVLGADPRRTATDGTELLRLITQRAAEVSIRLLEDTSLVQRSRYIETLQLAVKVLSKTFEMRQQLPKSHVPSITTPAYLAYCQAIYNGDYEAAKRHIESKLGDLTA